MKSKSDHSETRRIQASSEKGIELPVGVPPLGAFYLYITNGCNLACRHCWITPKFVNGKPSPGDCLKLDLLKLAVSDGKRLGLTNAKLTGGEPLLHPQFIEIVDYLSNENISLAMETNATLVTKDCAKYLKDNSKVWHISASLDSVNPERHDFFRGVKGAFNEAVRGIKYLVSAGYRPQVIMCPYRGNIDEVEDMAKFAVDLGAGSVKFNPVTSAGRGKEMKKRGETLDYSEVINLVRFIRGELQDKISIPLFIGVPPAMSTMKELLSGRNAGGQCKVLNILGILGDGEMALCGIGRNIPELCFGTLGKDDLISVWISNPTLVKLRKELNDDYPGICGDCVHSRSCLTHCVAMNYVNTGKLINPDYLCAEAAYLGEFPETRKKSFSPDL